MGLQSVTLTAFCSGLGVAPIAEVLDSDFASEEPVSRVFAQRRAELDTGAELGTFFEFLRNAMRSIISARLSGAHSNTKSS